jgi:hypothetical protein
MARSSSVGAYGAGEKLKAAKAAKSGLQGAGGAVGLPAAWPRLGAAGGGEATGRATAAR